MYSTRTRYLNATLGFFLYKDKIAAGMSRMTTQDLLSMEEEDLDVSVSNQPTSEDRLDEIAERMKTEIEMYVNLERELVEIKKRVRDLAKERNVLQEAIMKCMRENGLFEIRANDGSIRLEEKNKPSSLNKDTIKQCLAERIDDENMAEAITESIFKNRPMVSTSTLKIKGQAGRRLRQSEPSSA